MFTFFCNRILFKIFITFASGKYNISFIFVFWKVASKKFLKSFWNSWQLLIPNYLQKAGQNTDYLVSELCYFCVPLKEHCSKNTKAVFPSWGLLFIVPNTLYPFWRGGGSFNWQCLSTYKNTIGIKRVHSNGCPHTFFCPTKLCQIVARWCTPVSKISQICSK